MSDQTHAPDLIPGNNIMKRSVTILYEHKTKHDENSKRRRVVTIPKTQNDPTSNNGTVGEAEKPQHDWSSYYIG